MLLVGREDIKKVFVEVGMGTTECARISGMSHVTIRNVLARQPVLPATAKKFCNTIGKTIWECFELVE